jgi:tetratricopeptide (TPR) repeat protein
VALLGLASGAYSQEDTTEVSVDGSIHEPRELLQIAEKSSVLYLIELLPEDTLLEEEGLTVLPPDYYRDTSGGDITLMKYETSDPVEALLATAEGAFGAKDYQSALKLYREMLKLDPQYYCVLTLIGDAWYMMEEYDSAVVAFQRAIEYNYINYQSHWFLADTYWKLGEKEKAVKELTIAHVLNRNHSTLKEVLMERREDIGRPWKDWEFKPQYILEKIGDSVRVAAKESWLGYALAKALWKYEPGYRQKMSQDASNSSQWSTLEEKEALFQCMAFPEQHETLMRILNSGYASEFLYYEIMATRYPATVLMMPEPVSDRLIEYINTFH